MPQKPYLLRNGDWTMKAKSDGYRRDKIARYLREYTERVLSDASVLDPGIDASFIAQALLLNRTNVSRDLNSLYRNGTAIKLLGRPTRYLHFRTASNHFPGQYVPNTIPAGQSLPDFLAATTVQEKTPPVIHLPTLIDPQLPSLRYIFQQAESAVNYPPYGLHTLLIGEYGIGRSSFAEKMFAYGKATGRFSPSAKLYVFDCRGASNSIQSLTIQLFGSAAGAGPPSSPSRKGLVERAEDSMLLLTEAQYLPLPVQEKLIDLITHNTFTRFGESSVPRQSKLMLAATCCGDPDPVQTPLLRCFPVHITIPSLSQRTAYERFLYLYQLFQGEAAALECEFQISKSVLYYLVCAAFTVDVITLRGSVKSISSMAYHEYSGSDQYRLLDISYRHLPPTVSACQLPPDEAVEFLDALSRYPDRSFHIHANSLPPTIWSASRENLAENIPLLVSDDPSLFYVKKYLESYLRRAAQSFDSPIGTDPVLTSHILRCLADDNVLGALGPDSPLIQSVADLFANTLHPDADYHMLHLSETNMACTQIPEDLKALSKSIETDFCRLADQKFSDYRASIIALYLHLIRSHILSTQIRILFVFHGEGVSAGLASYIEATFHCPAIPIPCGLTSTLESILAELDHVLASMPPNVQLLFFTDGLPFDQLHCYAEKTYALPARTICGAAFETIVQTVRAVVRFHFSLDMVCEEEATRQEQGSSPHKPPSLIAQAALNLLTPSLDFLDISKALPLLESSFQEISQQLSLDASDSNATKYQFHCAHMIERSIRKEFLDYPHLKSFLNQHHQAFRIVGNAMRPIEQSYGIHIPTSEIAYLVEIFLSP